MDNFNSFALRHIGLSQTDIDNLLNQLGYEIIHEQGKGVVLSGSFSPMLQSSIGLARVDQGYPENGKVFIRNKALNIEFVSPRFIRKVKMQP